MKEFYQKVLDSIREQYKQTRKVVSLHRLSKKLGSDRCYLVDICKYLEAEGYIEFINNCADRTVPKNEYVVPIK